ncbi:MAG: SurA N-terminal domain-containing protein [Nitrospirae bacterium]|nr:SurA N-terminal domain-containing protein [Nitrospirota bacterium]MCL5236642.1 SurA N-terminal domain-containing protein [Nitrospirota bacterium]
MLKSMRKHAKFFYVLFVIVILSFVFWGVGTVDKSTAVAVAEIGKEKITIEEYWRAYERMRELYREINKGQSLDEEAEKKLKLKEMVLNSLIEERILLVSARELGITVSDRELQDAITGNPRFMRDGIFRQDVYFRTLQLERQTPEMFESSERQRLMLAKMAGLIWSSVDAASIDLKGLPGDEKKSDELKQSVLLNMRSAAIKSYAGGMRQRMNVKVNMNLIS